MAETTEAVKKNFEQKYCSEKDKDKPENKAKIPISNEGFAMCECLEELRKMIFRLGRNK